MKHFDVPGAARHTPTRQEADESSNNVLVMCGSTCVFCVKTRQDSRAALSSGASGLRTFSNSSSVSSSSWQLI
ncbi:hypothetical protein EYF80_030098 [Liparis tanakae]|uniref:Uncharacterized protein n=1 Tax=Liparis tanakae TaxID=230148 RepID=A0A4Z2H1G9_9TELE|nr:hypothetical protein EYF80_030098 [Liparis tanakae]